MVATSTNSAGSILLGENAVNLTKILQIVATYIQDDLITPQIEETFHSMILHIIQTVPGQIVARAFDDIPDDRTKATLMAIANGGGGQ